MAKDDHTEMEASPIAIHRAGLCAHKRHTVREATGALYTTSNYTTGKNCTTRMLKNETCEYDLQAVDPENPGWPWGYSLWS